MADSPPKNTFDMDELEESSSQLRRLKRTKLRCCPDNDGCNRCLRRGARYLLAHGPGGSQPDRQHERPQRSRSELGTHKDAPNASSSFAARLPCHLRARCESDWAMRHGDDGDFPFARQGLAAALRRGVPAALRLQQVGRCVLQVALEAGALGVALTGADDVQEVVVHMLARVIGDDESRGRGGDTQATAEGDSDGSDGSDDIPNLDVRGALEQVHSLLSRRRRRREEAAERTGRPSWQMQDATSAAEELHFDMIRRLAAQIARGGLGEQAWEDLDTTRASAAAYCSSFVDPWADSEGGSASAGDGCLGLGLLALLFRRRPGGQVAGASPPARARPEAAAHSPGKKSPATCKVSPARSRSPLHFVLSRNGGRQLKMCSPSPLKLKLEPKTDAS